MVLDRREDGGKCQGGDGASDDAGCTRPTCYFAAGSCWPIHRGWLVVVCPSTCILLLALFLTDAVINNIVWVFLKAKDMLLVYILFTLVFHDTYNFNSYLLCTEQSLVHKVQFFFTVFL